jgi:myo-inositol-1(or 4)-monophosphatase
MNMDYAEALKTGRLAAQAGAVVIREQFGLSRNRRIKAESQTLVTDTDIAAEKAIIEVLTSHSDYGILSEESGLSGESNGPVWVVDPLDGTSNFARSVPVFAVSIALMHENKVVAGVIVDPVHQKEYSAYRGGGAFINGTQLVQEDFINATPVIFVNHGHREVDKKRFSEITQRLALNFNQRKFGTTALELCYVATGNFDGFICSGDEIWDFAAGVLIASEAGCIFTDWQGNPWDGKSSYILVAKPAIHSTIVKAVNDLQ